MRTGGPPIIGMVTTHLQVAPVDVTDPQVGATGPQIGVPAIDLLVTLMAGAVVIGPQVMRRKRATEEEKRTDTNAGERIAPEGRG